MNAKRLGAAVILAVTGAIIAANMGLLATLLLTQPESGTLAAGGMLMIEAPAGTVATAAWDGGNATCTVTEQTCSLDLGAAKGIATAANQTEDYFILRGSSATWKVGEDATLTPRPMQAFLPGVLALLGGLSLAGAAAVWRGRNRRLALAGAGGIALAGVATWNFMLLLSAGFAAWATSRGWPVDGEPVEPHDEEE